MTAKILLVIILFPFAAVPQSGNLNKEFADSFISCLLNNPDSLHFFVMPEEIKTSERLGITYSGVKNKYLISNDIDDAVKSKTSEEKLKYNYNISALDDSYSRITLSFNGINYNRDYYFKNKYLISTPSYFSKSWKKIESRYFTFFVSNPEYFNQYSIDQLERFVDSVSNLLNFSDELKQRLAEKKIYYYLCANEDEIQNLTGFKTLGMYYMPYDYVISTYNCHYHELLHLLINYKLQNNELYTHPFLQEGFAVALGGRGGKEPPVILDMGSFLQNSGFMDYTELLSREQFISNDASMSYPVSGLYNLFLIQSLGIEKYLSLYRKYSGSNEQITKMTIDSTILPDRNSWLAFINAHQKKEFIHFQEKYPGNPGNKKYSVSKIKDDYLFTLKDTLLVNGKEIIPGYTSKSFKELFPGRIFKGEKFAVIASKDEVSVYNLYTNNLTAKYVRSFTLNQTPVPEKEGFYYFLVNENAFDGELD